MCLNVVRAYTNEKPITVYKVLERRAGIFRSEIVRKCKVRWTAGKRYKASGCCTIMQRRINGGCFHSYRTLASAVVSASTASDLYIAECVIPKGNLVFIGNKGDIASPVIKVVKILEKGIDYDVRT